MRNEDNIIEGCKGLGKEGDLVDVKDGYARIIYFLKISYRSYSSKLKQMKKKKKEWKLKKRRIWKCFKIKGKIESIDLKLKVKQEKVENCLALLHLKTFDALKIQHNIDIDKKKIELEDNIKTLGTTEVEIRYIRGLS